MIASPVVVHLPKDLAVSLLGGAGGVEVVELDISVGLMEGAYLLL